MLRYRCGRCLAEPGEWCTVQRGGLSALLHAYRFHRAVADEAFAWQQDEKGADSSSCVYCGCPTPCSCSNALGQGAGNAHICGKGASDA